MKFRVEDIPSEGREEKFNQAEGWLEDRLVSEAERSFRLKGPVAIHLTLSRSGRGVLVESRIEVRVEWLCARCLEPFSRVLSSALRTCFKPKPDFPLPAELELNREELETEFYEGDEFVLDPLVQDQVLLALPPKAVCREECRGLCPRCGKNLNRETCQCQEGAGDPRFEVLKSLRDH